MRSLQFMFVGFTALVMAASAPAAAQQPNAVQGTWIITAVFDQYENGEKKDPWGAQLKGQITFSGDGHWQQIILGTPDAALKSNDPRKPDAPVVAQAGSYTVDSAGKINAKIEIASYSGRAGTETGWTAKLSGDTLTLVGTPRKDQFGTFSPNLQLKRAGK